MTETMMAFDTCGGSVLRKGMYDAHAKDSCPMILSPLSTGRKYRS